MVKPVDEIMQALNTALGEGTSDETLSLLEDVKDTLDAGADNVDWKKKYEQNDEEWRQRYRNRFTQGGDPEQEQPDKPSEEPETHKLTFENLFKEG